MYSVIQHILLCSCISATGSRGLTRLKSRALGKAGDGMSVDCLCLELGVPLPLQSSLCSLCTPLFLDWGASPTPSSSCYLKLALGTVRWVPIGYSGALWFSNLSDVPLLLFQTGINYTKAWWLLVVTSAYSWLGTQGSLGTGYMLNVFLHLLVSPNGFSVSPFVDIGRFKN